MLDPTTHRKWLNEQLVKYSIGKRDLEAISKALENTIDQTYEKNFGQPLRVRAFFSVFNREGWPTRGWDYIAELAIWLKYTDYPPAKWFEFLCSRPNIKFIMQGGRLPNLSQLIPRTRQSRDAIQKLNEEFNIWIRRH